MTPAAKPSANRPPKMLALRVRELRGMMVLARPRAPMSPSILPLLDLRTPAQVRRPIVRRIAVQMTNLLTLLRKPVKREAHQPMNRLSLAPASVAHGYQKITLLPSTSHQRAPRDSLRPAKAQVPLATVDSPVAPRHVVVADRARNRSKCGCHAHKCSTAGRRGRRRGSGCRSRAGSDERRRSTAPKSTTDQTRGRP